MANNPYFDFTPTLSSSYSHSSSSSWRASQSTDNNPYFEFQGSSSSSSYHRSPPGGSRRSSASSGGQRRYRTTSPINTFHGPPPPPASTTGNGGWREIERVAGSDSTHQQDKTALGDALLEGSKHGGPQSVCVLDTNTLVHAAAFFESLFRLLLQGMAKASSPISSSSSSTSSGRHSNPFVLVIPHFVLEELDALKVRPSVGPQARKANHILLRALEAQQRLARQLRQREDGGHGRSSSPKNSGEELPRSRLCILVEKAQEALPRSARSTGWSVDVALVSLCHTLQRQTGLPVVFCSNDTNARTRAEIEGVQTFDLGAVLRASARVRARERSKVRRVSGGDRSSAASIWSGSGRRGSDGDERAAEGRIGEASCPDEAPEMLLEQWAVQIGGGATGSDADGDWKSEAGSARVGEQALPSLHPSNGYATALSQPSTEDDGMDMDLDAQAAAPHQEHTHQPQDAVTKRTRLSTSDPPPGRTAHFPASTNQLADLPPSADVELNPTFHWPSGGTTSWSCNSFAKPSSQRQPRPLPKSGEARRMTSDGRTANGGAWAS